VILTRTIGMCITLSKCEMQGGRQGDHSNVKAITLDHSVRCPSRGIVVEEWEPDSKISACGFGEGMFGKCPHRRGNGHEISPAD
jgi:hypothetical protein